MVSGMDAWMGGLVWWKPEELSWNASSMRCSRLPTVEIATGRGKELSMDVGCGDALLNTVPCCAT